jgi:phenol hydroxylase P3 protein
MHDRVWYLSVPKSFFDDAITAGPFEFMVAIGFSFEYVLTNLLFVPFISGAAYNGDMGTMTFGFSAQSDEARHMTLGLESSSSSSSRTRTTCRSCSAGSTSGSGAATAC